MSGVAGFAFLTAFALLFAWSLVATRAEQRREELDAYERAVGGGWG